MCGRFVQSSPGEVLKEAFGLAATLALTPCYNVAPTMEVAAIRLLAGDEGQVLVRLRWGLVPHWAGDPGIGSRLINARSETAADRPAFRDAFLSRRCLVPADGFYEWQTAPSGKKQPYLIRLENGRPFAMAGLWERWHDPRGAPIETVTILTTDANDLVRKVHERMPVILEAPAQLQWLDPAIGEPGRLQALMRPFRSDALEMVPVSQRVNHVANDDPSLVERITLPRRGQLDLF